MNSLNQLMQLSKYYYTTNIEKYINGISTPKVLSALLAAYIIRRLYILSRSKSEFELLPSPSPHVHPNYIVNKQGMWLYTKQWIVDKPIGYVFLLSGYGDSCSRYEHVAQYLNTLQLNVFTLDHQGNGQSQGSRAYVEKFSDYVQDYLQYIELIQSRYPQLPTFILGHSMGGLITVQILRATIQNDKTKEISGEWNGRLLWPFSGVILSSPAIIPDPTVATPFNIFLANCLSTVLPKFGIEPLKINSISSNENVIKLFKEDPLTYHGYMRARWGYEMLQTMKSATSAVSSLTLPILIVQGTKDRIVNENGAKLVFERIQSEDKTLRIHEQGYHELFNDDVTRQQVLTEFREFIIKRINIENKSIKNTAVNKQYRVYSQHK